MTTLSSSASCDILACGQGVRVASEPDPPGELVIEPCLDHVSPDYDIDPDLIYANG